MSKAGSSPLRANRDFQLLWSGQAISVLGSRISLIAYPMLVLAITESPAAAGAVGFVGSLPYILFQLPAGAVMDRIDRRLLMIVCDVIRLLALGSLPLALSLGHLPLAQVAIVAFVEGTAFVVFRLGEVAAVRLTVQPEQYASALSQNEGRIRAANLLGPLLGGIMFQLGRGAPFLVDALSYLVSLVTLLLIRTPFSEPRDAPAEQNVLAEIGEGMAWLWRERFILVTVLVAAASNLFFQALVLALIVLTRDRGTPPGLIGAVLAGLGVGGVLGSLSGAWIQRHFRPTTVVIGTVWVWAALTPFVTVVPGLVSLAVLLAGMAFVGAAWNVALNTYYYRIVPDRLIARVSSVGSLAAFGALPLGSLIAGLLLQLRGPVMTCFVLAAGMLLLALVATLSPSVRRGPPLPATASS